VPFIQTSSFGTGIGEKKRNFIIKKKEENKNYDCFVVAVLLLNVV